MKMKSTEDVRGVRVSVDQAGNKRGETRRGEGPGRAGRGAGGSWDPGSPPPARPGPGSGEKSRGRVPRSRSSAGHADTEGPLRPPPPLNPPPRGIKPSRLWTLHFAGTVLRRVRGLRHETLAEAPWVPGAQRGLGKALAGPERAYWGPAAPHRARTPAINNQKAPGKRGAGPGPEREDETDRGAEGGHHGE